MYCSYEALPLPPLPPPPQVSQQVLQLAAAVALCYRLQRRKTVEVGVGFFLGGGEQGAGAKEKGQMEGNWGRGAANLKGESTQM